MRKIKRLRWGYIKLKVIEVLLDNTILSWHDVARRVQVLAGYKINFYSIKAALHYFWNKKIIDRNLIEISRDKIGLITFTVVGNRYYQETFKINFHGMWIYYLKMKKMI